jgi:MOSC domain-containing protein YiiM
MRQAGILQSMQVGTPTQYGRAGVDNAMERRWETSFFRVPTAQPRWLFTTHLEGNAQADTKNHGTPSQTILLYASAHYPLWQHELQHSEIGPGGFSENFTVDGLTEETVCIGDIYAIGDAQIRVTEPRYPCWKIERRWSMPGLTAQVAATGRTGWYCNVQREGLIEPGLPIFLVERPYPLLTIALANDFAHGRSKDREKAQAFIDCPLLHHRFWHDLIARQVGIKKEVEGEG